MNPRFVETPQGKIFTLLYEGDVKFNLKDLAVICFPPFGEELNKSRRMMATQARYFAGIGIDTLIVDLIGTGDSEHDLSLARWEYWRENIFQLIHELGKKGKTRFIFWGIRLGALLALEMVEQVKPEKLLLWQPVFNGKMHMNQFLRLRMAADLLSDGEKITVKQLREDLKAGNPVEVSGYTLNPELVGDIDQLGVTDLSAIPKLSVDWFDVGVNPDRMLAKSTNDVISTWGASGLEVNLIKTTGEQFWNTIEITDVHELIKKCTKLVGNYVAKN